MKTFVFILTICTAYDEPCEELESAAGLTGEECIQMLVDNPSTHSIIASCQKD